jgi:SAM-dependent methyltransferase
VSGDAGTHRYFHVDWLPPLLAETARAQPPRTLVDLGAGDGATLYALREAALLPEQVWAVDLSAERIAVCASVSPSVRGLVADATDVAALPDGSVDAVVASQLIEHLPDDRSLAPELARLLRPGGWFYVSSVVRGPRSWWIYRRDGRTVLDPTHEREYASEAAFAAALAHPELEPGPLRSDPLRFPAADLALRAAAFARVLPFERLPSLYRDHPSLARLRGLRVPVPGYRWVETAGTRR